jgi:hypothetical protein
MMIGPEREVAPQVLVLLQHRAHFLRLREARVRPENPRFGPLPEQPFDGVDIGMRMQQQLVLLRQLDHPPRHRKIRIGAVQMEFADRGVLELAEAFLEVRRTVSSRNQVLTSPARSIGPERRNDHVRRRREQPLLPFVVRARNQRPAHARFAQHLERRRGGRFSQASWL